MMMVIDSDLMISEMEEGASPLVYQPFVDFFSPAGSEHHRRVLTEIRILLVRRRSKDIPPGQPEHGRRLLHAGSMCLPHQGDTERAFWFQGFFPDIHDLNHIHFTAFRLYRSPPSIASFRTLTNGPTHCIHYLIIPSFDFVDYFGYTHPKTCKIQLITISFFN